MATQIYTLHCNLRTELNKKLIELLILGQEQKFSANFLIIFHEISDII